MRINIRTNEQNEIVEWISYPIDETKPIFEIDDPYSIHIGIDKFINGELVKDEEMYNKRKSVFEKYEMIRKCKMNLDESDYKLFKYLDGALSYEEYEMTKTQRQAWRDEINRLEKEIDELKV